MTVWRVVEGKRRDRLAHEVLDGWVSGPDAPIEATAAALVRAASARTLVLVEGISDQIALETLAGRLGRDLSAEGIVVVPIGGAQAVTRYLVRFGPAGAGLSIVGLCDAAEESYFRRGLAAVGLGPAANRIDLERLGFFVCENDLEDELIRASGQVAIENLLHSHGDLDSLRILQKQPAWREECFAAQMRRWLGAGSRRKLRYARLLVLAVELDRMPRPLTAVLAATAPNPSG
ncbi:MAG TPA: TOPRIM nucleotidyl transferase/hydrolase domain-containing protein [Propionibacteriaceae bacterium]|nr:TOPRIM nucleotidyl transferase/hydrolase domain-containing protein [Propionibacteriaceae bacterium]